MELKEKLLLIQKELKAPKNLFNKFGGYSYRSCESILESCKELLEKNKVTVVISDEIIAVADRIYVKATATIKDCESNEEISVSAFAREPLSAKGQSEAQITGATSSYARKYALNGLFLIDDNKDADTQDNREENKGEGKTETKKPVSKPTVSSREQLKKIIEKYEADLEGKPLDMSCEALADNDPEKIDEMLGRCTAYLGRKGIKVEL